LRANGEAGVIPRVQVKILMVGCGSIGERHLRCFQHTGRAQLFACDTNPALLEKIKRQYGVAGFPDLRSALKAEQFEGVVICAPAHVHISMAITSVRAGAAVLIEKPLSVKLEEVDELKRELATSGRFAAVAYVYHFHPGLTAARALLAGGSLGRPLQVAVVCGQHFPTYRPAYREIYYNRHETGGGAIQDMLTHLVNAVEWLIGPSTRVYCEAAHQALEGVTVEDTVCASARNGDVLVNYTLNQFQPPNEATFMIHCENGSLKLEWHEQRWAVWRRGATEWEYQAAPVKERDDLFVAQAQGFLDGMGGAITNLCTVEEAVQTLKFNLAALQSARSGEPVGIG
jgi:predicted dehydrogenase